MSRDGGQMRQEIEDRMRAAEQRAEEAERKLETLERGSVSYAHELEQRAEKLEAKLNRIASQKDFVPRQRAEELEKEVARLRELNRQACTAALQPPSGDEEPKADLRQRLEEAEARAGKIEQRQVEARADYLELRLRALLDGVGVGEPVTIRDGVVYEPPPSVDSSTEEPSGLEMAYAEDVCDRLAEEPKGIKEILTTPCPRCNGTRQVAVPRDEAPYPVPRGDSHVIVPCPACEEPKGEERELELEAAVAALSARLPQHVVDAALNRDTDAPCEERCPDCHGSGEFDGGDYCGLCDSTGTVDTDAPSQTCEECNGDKRIYAGAGESRKCPACKGTGRGITGE